MSEGRHSPLQVMTHKLPVLLLFRSPVLQYLMLSLYKCCGKSVVTVLVNFTRRVSE